MCSPCHIDMYTCINVGEKFALHKNDAMVVPCYKSVGGLQVEKKEVNTFTGIILSGASE